MVKNVYRNRATKKEVAEFKELVNVLKWYDRENKGYKMEYLETEVLQSGRNKEYTLIEWLDVELLNTSELMEENKTDIELLEFYSDYYNRLNLLDIKLLMGYDEKFIKPLDVYEDMYFVNTPTIRGVK